MLYNSELLIEDPSLKNADWANNLVTHFRQYWKPLVSQEKAEKGMNLIMSRYDMTNVLKMFKDPKKVGAEFLPIAIMEKIRNILIGERLKAGISVNVNAIDPAAEDQRSADRSMLVNRSQMEELFSFLQQSIGLPEYKLSNEKKISGRDVFKGNVEMFDQLGLDAASEYQVAYFFQTWHRLLHEMDAQDIVNYYNEFNEVAANIENWINDMMAKRAVAMQVYVDETSGATVEKYMAPESVMVIPGKRDDGKDAVCVGYEETVTVSEVIRRMGNSIDLVRDLNYFMLAVNYANRREYTGVWDGNNFYGTKTGDVVYWNDFINFKVQIGYIEWKSWDASVTKMGVDYHGNLRSYNKPADWNPAEETPYAKEVKYYQNTYKAFFMATSTYSQRLYKYGKLYRQVIEGADDEYSNYSVLFKKTSGKTIAEISEPWIDLAQEAFVKMRWMIRKAKPKGRAYNYDSLIKVGNRMIRSGNSKQDIHGVIKMFEEGINEIFTTPELNGEKIGGGGSPNHDLPNGLDPTAITFKAIIEWAIMNIKNDIAMTQIREAYNAKPNDGYGLQMEAKESSENATFYIWHSIDTLVKNSKQRVLMLNQDITRYPDSIAFRFFNSVFGKEKANRLKELGNIGLHRYNIFLNSLSTYMQRQQVYQDTKEAWQMKEISYDVKMLVDSIDDFRKAAYVLAFQKVKADKEKQMEVQRAHENAMALEQMKNQNKMAEIDRAGWWNDKRENTRGNWYYYTMNAQLASKADIQRLKEEHDQDKLIMKTDQKIREDAAERSNELQETLI